MSSPKQATSDHLVILVVDDDAIFRNRLCRAFHDRDCEAHEADTAEETLHLARGISPDLVLLDLKMPNLSGLDLIQDIKKLDSTIAVIILTGYGSIATAMQALKLGADHYLSKPADAEQILAAYYDLNTDSSGKKRANHRAVSGESRMGTHPACALRLLRQYLAGCKTPWHSPAARCSVNCRNILPGVEQPPTPSLS